PPPSRPIPTRLTRQLTRLTRQPARPTRTARIARPTRLTLPTRLALPARPLAVGLLAALGLMIGAGIASAHVTVNPGIVEAGAYTKLTFRVPNESAKANTVKITVNFPMDHPFASVAIKKEPGWTAKATTSKLATPISDDDNATITQAVSSITWTASTGSTIALGEFAEFDVSVGPVPRVDAVVFRAVQTYDDGSVVDWNEPTPASGVEPEHPAPVLRISTGGTDAAGKSTPAAAAGTPASGSAGAITVTAAAPVPGAALPTGADNPARTLGVLGILVGAVGVLIGAFALRRPRVTS
ncbi:MAG: YcnI family copper-binding membrane protein, partial [Nakamurella sp.]